MITLCSDSLSRYGLNRIFRFTKEAEYDGIEIAITKNFDTQNAVYIQELVDEYELPIMAISAPQKSTKSAIEKTIKMAKKMNCPVVVLQPPDLLDFKLTSWIKNEVPKIAKKEKIHICLENTEAKTFLGILPKYALNSLAELKQFKSVCLSTSNLSSKKIDLMRVYDKLKGNIKHIHFSNSKGSKNNTMPDNGILPLESFLKSLKRDEYKGSISMRIKPAELKAGNDGKVRENLKKAKAFFEEYYK